MIDNSRPTVHGAAVVNRHRAGVEFARGGFGAEIQPSYGVPVSNSYQEGAEPSQGQVLERSVVPLLLSLLGPMLKYS